MKLLEHLEILSKKEQMQFLELSKAWYPQAKIPLRFLKHLIDELVHSGSRETAQLDFGEFTKLSQKRLQNIQSIILSWFRRFLACAYYYEQHLPDLVAYLKFCLDWQINTGFIEGLRKQSIKKEDFADADKLRELYLIQHVLYYHPLALEKDNINDPVFQKMIFYFDAYQYCVHLEHRLEALVRKNIVSAHDTNPTLAVKISEHFSVYPLIQAFELLIAAYSSPSFENVMRAKKMIWEELESYSDNQQARFLHRIKNLYAHLIRTKQIDRATAANYLFEHYKLLDQKNYLVEGQRMQYRTFTNIINVALKIKEYDWIEKFIRRYQEALPKQGREAVVTLTKADVLFSQGEFKKAIKTLPKRAKDPLIEIRCKGLEICCMVELKMDEFAIEQKCRTLSAKLGKNINISQEILQAARSFLNLVRKLVGGSNKRSEIEAYFKETKAVFFHDWLARKMQSYPKNGIS